MKLSNKQYFLALAGGLLLVGGIIFVMLSGFTFGGTHYGILVNQEQNSCQLYSWIQAPWASSALRPSQTPEGKIYYGSFEPSNFLSGFEDIPATQPDYFFLDLNTPYGSCHGDYESCCTELGFTQTRLSSKYLRNAQKELMLTAVSALVALLVFIFVAVLYFQRHRKNSESNIGDKQKNS